jgi:hypothetical protein
LDYCEFRDVAKSRKTFAAYVMNFCVKGYQTRVYTELDILTDKSMWPTLCILKGNDNSTNHAVTIVEDFIFDSNNHYALPLTVTSLDWCVSGDDGEEVKFLSVPFAYRFYKHNPAPQLLLRGEKKNLFAFNSVISALLVVEDEKAVKLLQDTQHNISPSENVIAVVREQLKCKDLGYVPVALKNMEDLLLQSVINENVEKKISMFLVHIRGSFHYSIFSSVGNVFFNGSKGGPICLSPENVYNEIESSNDNEYTSNDNEYTSSSVMIELLKGYVFVKRRKSSKSKKRKI